MIVAIYKGRGVTGALRYVQGEGRDDLTGKLKAKIGDNSRAELLGGQGFGFELKTKEDAELARKIMEHWGKPENQASKTRACEIDCEHIVMAWAKGQSADREEKIKAARGLLAALGMENARAVYYAHHDADHPHLHLVVSRLNPDTGKAYSQFEDMYRSQAWALQYERESKQITPSRQWMHNLADAARSGDHKALRGRLTEKEATFSRKEAERAFAWGGLFGKDRDKARDAFLADHEIVPLRETADGPVKAYTTRGVLMEEREVMREARALHERSTYGLKPETIEKFAIKHNLTPEQVEALQHVTGPNGLAMIAGQAGTGKSRVLMAAREAYESEGYQVRGIAWTNKCVANMRRAGFEASTITAELHRLEREPDTWADGKTVLMIDEAAQLSTKTCRELFAAAAKRGAKGIPAGDDRQTGSIERGGLFRVMRDAFDAAYLTEVHRVRDEKEKQAWNGMHGGKGARDFTAQMRLLEERGALHWSANHAQAFRALGDKYIADFEAAPDKRRLMIAPRNEDVRALNVMARALHRERGLLGEDHVFSKGGEEVNYAKGDRIVLNENARTKAGKARGFVSGAFGRIVDIEKGGDGTRDITVELDGEPGKPGKQFRFPYGANRERAEFDGFSHGWASTVYKSQGDTLDQIYDLHSASRTTRASSHYVSKTRHRETIDVFVAKDRTKNFDELVEQMARGADKTAASSYHYEDRDVALKEAAREAQRAAEKQAWRDIERLAKEAASQAPAKAAGREADKDGAAAHRCDERGTAMKSGQWTDRGGMPPQQESAMAALKAAHKADVEAGRAVDSPLGWISPGEKFGAKVNDAIERAETANQARDAAKQYDKLSNAEKPAQKGGPEPIAQVEPVSRAPDGVSRGISAHVHNLGKQPAGTASRLREAFTQSKDGKGYMAALQAQGFRLAQIDGLDAAESRQRSEDARAAKAGRRGRVYQQGELVAVNNYGTTYQIDTYITGATRADIKAKTADIDRGALPNLKSAYTVARQAENQRAAEPQKEHEAGRSQERGTVPAVENVRSALSGIASGVGKAGSAAKAVVDRYASMLESALTSDAASRGAKTAREARAMEHEAAYRREQDQHSKVAQGQTRGDPVAESQRALNPAAQPGGAPKTAEEKKAERWADLASQFTKETAKELEQDGGRGISPGGGGGTKR